GPGACIPEETALAGILEGIFYGEAVEVVVNALPDQGVVIAGVKKVGAIGVVIDAVGNDGLVFRRRHEHSVPRIVMGIVRNDGVRGGVDEIETRVGVVVKDIGSDQVIDAHQIGAILVKGAGVGIKRVMLTVRHVNPGGRPRIVVAGIAGQRV